jgi:hypothetical protein
MEIVQWIAIMALLFMQVRNMLIANRVADLLDRHAKMIDKAFELLSKLARTLK